MRKITDDMIKTYVREMEKRSAVITKYQKQMDVELDELSSKLSKDDTFAIARVAMKSHGVAEPLFPYFMIGIFMLLPVTITLLLAYGSPDINWSGMRNLGIGGILFIALAFYRRRTNKEFGDRIRNCRREVLVDMVEEAIDTAKAESAATEESTENGGDTDVQRLE